MTPDVCDVTLTAAPVSPDQQEILAGPASPRADDGSLHDQTVLERLPGFRVARQPAHGNPEVRRYRLLSGRQRRPSRQADGYE